MYYLGPIVTWFVRKRIGELRGMMEHPHEAQQRVFEYLLQSAADTEWGNRHEYDSIRSYREYCNRVPVQDYESLKPYINRLVNGEQNVLWHSPVKWFAKSSGTTSDASKFIPMTDESIEDGHYKAAMDLLTMYCETFADTNIFSGKGLVLGGSHRLNPLNQFSAYGDLSAVLLQNMSFIAQLYRTPDLTIALMDDWERKLELLAQTTAHENVTNISGVPTWMIVLAKRLFEITGKQTLREVWPALELYVHGGVNFAPYRDQFARIAGDGLRYLETYNASEGFFAFQSDWQSPGMLLHLNAGIFYEFIPQGDWHNENPQTLTLEQVTTGEYYAIVVSTNGGLWRYKVGDTIKFTSLAPYKIEVTGRIKHYINAFGEEVIADNAERALEAACRDAHAVVRDYTVAPVYLSLNARGRHEWLIEFEQAPDDLNYFTQQLDHHLRQLNTDYDAKRSKDLALMLPLVHALPEGSFHQWLKQKGKFGGQHKVPRLSNDRSYADEILGMIGITNI